MEVHFPRNRCHVLYKQLICSDIKMKYFFKTELMVFKKRSESEQLLIFGTFCL